MHVVIHIYLSQLIIFWYVALLSIYSAVQLHAMYCSLDVDTPTYICCVTTATVRNVSQRLCGIHSP